MKTDNIKENFNCPVCGGELIVSLEDIKIRTLENGSFNETHNEGSVNLHCYNELCNDIRFGEIFLYEDEVFFENGNSKKVWRLYFTYSHDNQPWESSQQVVYKYDPEDY